MPFSIYNKMDITKKTCIYTIGMPVEAAAEIGHGVVCTERPACKALKLTHTGAYRHLGNAWATAISDMRYAKLKEDKKNPPFEIYINDPENTAEAALITEIYMPVKG